MKRTLLFIALGLSLCLSASHDAEGRGFGGSGSASHQSSGSYSGSRGSGSYESSGSHSYNTYSGSHGGAGATSSYDRSYSGSHGGSYSAQGERGAAEGPRGGTAAGSSRDVNATGPDGRSYSSSSQRGAAAGPYGGYAAGGSRSSSATGTDGRSYSESREGGVAAGPYGRTVGGASSSASATGARGTVSGSSSSAYASRGMSTDFGMAHYSSFNGAATAHSTVYRSPTAVTAQGNSVRSGFGYYNSFQPTWNTAHPGAWSAAGWNASSAWSPASWGAVSAACAIPAQPIDYDYGNTVVYQNNTIYQDGQEVSPAPQYTQQATTLATQGQQAAAPPDQTWTPLGVFALVQGDEKISNNVFQIAVDNNGVLRGNYYDGFMDTTTPIYGSVDKKTQRAAWTIGKSTKRVFDAGIFNLTKNETPVLVHIGDDQTQQLLLVRVEQPKK